MSQLAIGVVMVTRDLLPMTQTSITALEKALEVAGILKESQLVLVDNSSFDPLQRDEIVTKVAFQIVRLDKRHSFSAASNWGAKKLISKDLLLFLNNDVFLHPLALTTLLSDRLSFSAAICGARLVYVNGHIQHAGVSFGAGSQGPYHINHNEPSCSTPRVTTQLQSVTGAVMLIDSSLFWQLQGFDEIFPFAYEDTDFCLRAAEVGAKTICSQTVDSVHLSGQTRDSDTIRFEKASRDLFLARWGGRVGSLQL